MLIGLYSFQLNCKYENEFITLQGYKVMYWNLEVECDIEENPKRKKG